MRESDLYKPVAQFLERRYGIAHKNTWTAGSGRNLSFLAGFGRRIPDVVACKPHPLKPEVHLAEGKLLNIRTHGFEETVNQLDSFRSYGDFLWAVFPLSNWSSASTNHDRWISQLRQGTMVCYLSTTVGQNHNSTPRKTPVSTQHEKISPYGAPRGL